MAKKLDLPAPPALERLTRGLATLDAILSDDWESRYYSFDAGWGKGERMASMRDGQGDEWFLVFTGAGAFLKGLAHEHPPGDVAAIYDGLPAKLKKQLREPAFSMDDTSYGGWSAGGAWTLRGAPKLKRVMAEHLEILDGDPKRYAAFARDYYEVKVPVDAIRRIYAGEKLDQALVSRINPARKLAGLREDLKQIGYGAR